MASRIAKLAVLLSLALVCVAATARAQTPEPLRLSFSDAVSRAAGTAPAVTLAGLRADEVRARIRQTRATLLPDLSATGSWASQTLNPQAFGFKISAPGFAFPKLFGPFDLYDARLHLTQTVFDYAGVVRVRAARSQLASSESDSGLASESAAQLAALSYLRATRSQAVVAARIADSTLAVELVQLAQAQKDAEVGTTIDVTRAQTQLVATRGALVVARNEAERARIDLVRSLGLPADTPVQLTDTLAATLPTVELPDTRDALVTLALSRRPDLHSEEARGLAASRTASAIKAERLPRLDLSANYGANGLAPDNLTATRFVALQLTVPILDGFRREGREAEQQAVVKESGVRADELKRQIAAEVDAARLDLGSAAEQQAIAAERLRLAQAELEEAQQRFKAGVAGNIEVIDAQVSLVRARDTDIDARFAAAAARVALARAVGSTRQLH
jgi:outer membrane protein TolC